MTSRKWRIYYDTQTKKEMFSQKNEYSGGVFLAPNPVF